MLDEIEASVSEAVKHLHAGKAAMALLELKQVQGVLLALQNETSKWDRVQRAYEAGERPAQLAARFGIKSQAIRNRAYYGKWQNPNKLAKIASVKKNKNIFHIVCQGCELYFETTSGHAKVCPTCKAFENMGRDRE